MPHRELWTKRGDPLAPDQCTVDKVVGEMLVTEDRDDRVMVFIDLANALMAIQPKESTGLRLDFYRLVKELVGPRRLMGAYVFDAIQSTDRSVDVPKRRLLDALRYLGFRVVVREVSFTEGEQKEVDIALATEMLANAFRDAYDVAILVSGDRDFVPAVERIRAEGRRVEVAFFSGGSPLEQGRSFSHHLQKVADRVHELDALPILQVVGLRPEVGP